MCAGIVGLQVGGVCSEDVPDVVCVMVTAFHGVFSQKDRKKIARSFQEKLHQRDAVCRCGAASLRTLGAYREQLRAIRQQMTVSGCREL
jgi:hypothetical protein